MIKKLIKKIKLFRKNNQITNKLSFIKTIINKVKLKKFRTIIINKYRRI